MLRTECPPKTHVSRPEMVALCLASHPCRLKFATCSKVTESEVNLKFNSSMKGVSV